MNPIEQLVALSADLAKVEAAAEKRKPGDPALWDTVQQQAAITREQLDAILKEIVGWTLCSCVGGGCFVDDEPGPYEVAYLVLQLREKQEGATHEA